MKLRRDGSARPGSFGRHVDGWLADGRVPGQRWKYFALVSFVGLAIQPIIFGVGWVWGGLIKRMRGTTP